MKILFKQQPIFWFSIVVSKGYQNAATFCYNIFIQNNMYQYDDQIQISTCWAKFIKGILVKNIT